MWYHKNQQFLGLVQKNTNKCVYTKNYCQSIEKQHPRNHTVFKTTIIFPFHQKKQKWKHSPHAKTDLSYVYDQSVCRETHISLISCPISPSIIRYNPCIREQLIKFHLLVRFLQKFTYIVVIEEYRIRIIFNQILKLLHFCQ